MNWEVAVGIVAIGVYVGYLIWNVESARRGRSSATLAALKWAHEASDEALYDRIKKLEEPTDET